MAKPMKFKSLTEKPLAVFDWVVFAFFALLCFFSFEQGGDILHTGGSSFAYLNGHILDFYEYNTHFVGANNYMPSSYILFAIWNIPIKLLGIITVPTVYNTPLVVEMWYKLLPTLFYMASSYVMYLIAVTVGMGNKKAKLCAYAFLTMPIGFFSQFIFGQYDSFTVFFMLLGLLFFFRKDWIKFSIFFGISLTFKYFPLMVFIPLLLLCEKRILHIIKYCLIVILPLALEILVYYPSSAFRSGVFGFGASGYIFSVAFTTQYFSISVFIVLWIVLAAAAYFQDALTDAAVLKWSLFYGNIVTFLLFGLSMWHPQWLLFAVPFWILGSFISKKFDIFMILETLMMLFFILFTVNFWINHVDQQMFSWGIFRGLLDGRINSFMTIREIYRIHDINLLYSILSGLLLVNAIFKHPKFCSEIVSEPVDQHWGWTRFRFLGGISIFLVPAFICFFIALKSPYLIYDTGSSAAGVTGVIVPEKAVAQVYTAKSKSISCIQVDVGTYARKNDTSITLNIIDAESKKTLSSTEIDTSKFVDNSYNLIKFDPVTTEVGKNYIFEFSSDNAVESDGITIYYSNTDSSDGNGYALVSGVKQTYDLCIKVFGEK